MSAIVDELVRDWRQAGVGEGEVLLLHSKTSRLLRRVLRADRSAGLPEILNSFLQALGPDGTLLLPLFNFQFTQGTPFDIRHTISEMGALTEAGRAYSGAVRTGHAIYSFAVIGAEAERFRGLANFTSYGADSPFQMLRDLGGKIAVLDLPDQNAMTIYHHFEEIVEAPYRYHKVFRGEWLDERGLAQWREFDIYVRGEGVVTHVDPMGEILWEKGLYSGDRPGEGCGLRVIDANAMFDATVDVIRKGQALGHLYLKESDL